MKKILVIILTILIISACQTIRRVETLPQIENPDKTAEIYVMRSKSMAGYARMNYIELDGKELFRIGPGTYTKFKVAADKYNREHRIRVGVTDFWGAPTNQGTSLVNLFCEPGEKYHFLIHFGFKEITEEEANKLIKEYKFYSLE